MNLRAENRQNMRTIKSPHVRVMQKYAQTFFANMQNRVRLKIQNVYTQFE